MFQKTGEMSLKNVYRICDQLKMATTEKGNMLAKIDIK